MRSLLVGLELAAAFLLFGFSGSLTSRECGNYVYKKRGL
jgi:hypothetical protein